MTDIRSGDWAERFAPAALVCGLAVLMPIATYPLMKRVTYWPQFFLGLNFNWGALMGWAAATGSLALPAFLLYAGGIAWTLGYDTIYAHQDKEDDVLVGVKSSALALGPRTRPWLFLFYAAAAGLWGAAGWAAGLGWPFWLPRRGVPPPPPPPLLGLRRARRPGAGAPRARQSAARPRQERARFRRRLRPPRTGCRQGRRRRGDRRRDRPFRRRCDRPQRGTQRTGIAHRYRRRDWPSDSAVAGRPCRRHVLRTAPRRAADRVAARPGRRGDARAARRSRPQLSAEGRIDRPRPLHRADPARPRGPRDARRRGMASGRIAADRRFAPTRPRAKRAPC